MTEPASPGSRRSYWSTLLPPLAAFVAVGLLAPLYSDEPFEIGLTAWQAVALWPIGLLVIGGPVLVLLGVRTAWLVRLGQVAIGVSGVVSMVAVARSEDAQAGLGFLWGPILGTGAAAALVAADAWLRRPRQGG